VNFWDSSAVVPLLVAEAMTPAVSEMLAADRQMHVWWATEVECAWTLARLEREGVGSDVVEAALSRLNMLREDWNEISAGTNVRAAARRLLRLHPLRAADALQLAAASALADGDPTSVTFLSLDDRLRQAARLEGFVLLP
jgi:predicted nucleic acid-binding protein